MPVPTGLCTIRNVGLDQLLGVDDSGEIVQIGGGKFFQWIIDPVIEYYTIQNEGTDMYARAEGSEGNPIVGNATPQVFKIDQSTIAANFGLYWFQEKKDGPVTLSQTADDPRARWVIEPVNE